VDSLFFLEDIFIGIESLPDLSLHLLTYVSQNHRMVGVGRDLCGSSSPTPLPKQGHLEQAAQDRVWAGLEYLQRRRIHNLSGQPGPGLRQHSVFSLF